MPYARGDVLLVPFPFTDLSRQKPRPAVVVSSQEFNQENEDIILVALSSKIERELQQTDFLISEQDEGFMETGLRVSSLVRCGKVITMHKSLVLMQLGTFNTTFMAITEEHLAEALGLT